MQLPDCLTQGQDGSIHVTGHRICLEHVVELVTAGATREDLHRHFPTLELPLIDKVLDYYHESRTEVDAYVATCRAESDRLYEATPRRFTLEQLRARFAEAQQ